MANRIAANNIEISYRFDGPTDAPVVMLSNSLLTDFGMWDLQVEALIKRYRVLRYDTRGHGGTAATPPPYTMDLLAGDVVALLDALRIQRVHFIGLSLGGMIAQRLASAHGDRLYSLSLCDTACRMPPESAWDERITLAKTSGTSAFKQPMTSRWLTEGYRKRHPEIVEKLGVMIERTSVDGMVGCAHAIKKMDHLPLLSGIKVPTLVVVGEHDIGTPVSAAQLLHREITGSRLTVIEHAAHLPNIEQTEKFNRAMFEFLATVH
jgi:3-oxoadipate enol-lactonase